MNKTEELEIAQEAFAQFSYGLYLLSVHADGVDNACVLNTVVQVTEQPPHILFALANATYTAELLHVGAKCSVSVLAEDTPFSLFRQFGYSSGRSTPKFDDTNSIVAANGTRYPKDHVTALVSATVTASIPCGTHTVYLADVTEARVVDGKPPLTYAYYQARVKGKA